MWDTMEDIAVYEWGKRYDKRKSSNSPTPKTMNSLPDNTKTTDDDCESGTTAAGVCGILGAAIAGGGTATGVGACLTSLGMSQSLAVLFGLFAAMPALVVGGAATAVCIYKVEGCIDAKKLEKDHPTEKTALNL